MKSVGQQPVPLPLVGGAADDTQGHRWIFPIWLIVYVKWGMVEMAIGEICTANLLPFQHLYCCFYIAIGIDLHMGFYIPGLRYPCFC